MDAKVHLKIIFIFNSEFFRELSHPKSVNYLLNWKSDSRIILVMFFTYLRINYTRLIPDEYTRAKTNIGVLAVIEANKLPTDNHFSNSIFSWIRYFLCGRSAKYANKSKFRTTGRKINHVVTKGPRRYKDIHFFLAAQCYFFYHLKGYLFGKHSLFGYLK